MSEFDRTTLSAGTPTTELPSTLEQSLVDYLQGAPTSEFQGQTVTVLEHLQGRDNLLWHVAIPSGTAIVKLFLDAGQARGRRQLDGHTTFAPLDIVPPPLWFDRYPHGLARQVLVYHYQPGALIDVTSTEQLDGLATTIAQVHTYPVHEVRRFCPHPLNLGIFWRIEKATINSALTRVETIGAAALLRLLQPITKKIAEAVQLALPLWESAPPTSVHGDLSPENCLRTPRGTIALLDWEMFGIGDPALDVARFLFHFEHSAPQGTVDRFLQTYLEQSPVREIVESGLPARIDIYRKLLTARALAYLINGYHQSLATTQANRPPSSPATDSSTSTAHNELVSHTVAATLIRTGSQFDLTIDTERAQAAVDEWIERTTAPSAT